MITLHHLETSRSQRILWLLEELRLPYDIVRYQRNRTTRLAPPELKKVHPLGKSPVITDDNIVIAESGAILEYLAEKYGHLGQGDVAHLIPEIGTEAYRQCRYWMHYTEGSLMNWLVMKLVFVTIPKQPMPFFVRPIARQLCTKVQEKLIDPNLATALTFLENHLANHTWFAGDELTIADFQMSFAIEALLTRRNKESASLLPSLLPSLTAYRNKLVQRPAYQRAIDIGGPVIMN
jgi:glutathione S-transferase